MVKFDINDQYIDAASLAKILGISTRTLHNGLKEGKYPKPDLLISAKKPRWKFTTIVNWLDAGGIKAAGADDGSAQ